MQRLLAVITCDTRMLLCISYSFLSSYFTGPKLSVVSWWTWKASPAIWNLHIWCHRYIFLKDIGTSCLTGQEKGDCWKLAAFWDLSRQRYKVDRLISYVYGLWPCIVYNTDRLRTWATDIKFILDDLRVHEFLNVNYWTCTKQINGVSEICLLNDIIMVIKMDIHCFASYINTG